MKNTYIYLISVLFLLNFSIQLSAQSMPFLACATTNRDLNPTDRKVSTAGARPVKQLGFLEPPVARSFFPGV